MYILLAAVILWFIAMSRFKGFWKVLGYWSLMLAVAVIGMAFGGWL